MTLKVGDRVRTARVGLLGTVIGDQTDDWGYRIKVRLDHCGRWVPYPEGDLELIDEET